jgi:hypothetical protein
MVKKIYRKKHNKTHRKLRMRGGEFTENEINELGVLGFNAQQIHTLEQLQNEIPIIINLVRQSTQQVNPTTNNLFTPQEIMDTLAEIPQDPEEIHDFLDESFGSFDENNDSMNTTQESISDISFGNNNDSSLHLSDLDINEDDSVNTTKESLGGKKNKTRKRVIKRKTRKTKKTKKTKTIKKNYKGGQCFGNGVGANSYDPNFSIYNTRALQLFPYKPTN